MTSSRHTGRRRTAIAGLAVAVMLGSGTVFAEVPNVVINQLSGSGEQVIRHEGHLYARAYGLRKTPLQPLETLLAIQATHTIALHLCGLAPSSQYTLRTSLFGSTVVAAKIHDEAESHVIVRVPDQKPNCEWYVPILDTPTVKEAYDDRKPNLQEQKLSIQEPNPDKGLSGVAVKTHKTEY